MVVCKLTALVSQTSLPDNGLTTNLVYKFTIKFFFHHEFLKLQFYDVPTALLACLVYLSQNWIRIFLGFIFSFYYVKRNKNQALYRWPFIGSIPSLISNSHRIPEWMTEVFLSLNGIGSLYIKGPIFTNVNYLVTCHPQNIEYILKTNFSNFPKGPEFKEVFDIHGDGMLTADADSWSFQRKMAHKGFTSMEFRSTVASTSLKMVKCKLVPFLSHVANNCSIVDFQDVCTRFAFDCSTSTLFGRDEEHLSIELPPNELSQAVDNIHEALIFRHVWPRFWWKLLRLLNIGMERNYARGWKKIDEILGEYISQKKESLAKGAETAIGLLSIYIKYLDESTEDDKCLTNAGVNKNFLREAMLGTFIAAKDAVASGLTWFFWLVAKNPKVEEKILEELKVVAMKNKQGQEDGAGTKWPLVFDPNDLSRLVYLHAALCESLRLYPPVPLNRKGVAEEDVLPDGSVVKPGMQILLSFYAEGHMPWIWGEDSSEFKPERWIDSEGKIGQELTSKFFVFNVGPRSCLGRNASFTEMMVVVVATLQLQGSTGKGSPSVLKTLCEP